MDQLLQNKIVIAGPCALESRQQLRHAVRILKRMGIQYVRACLWKPRTSPGWEGLGMLGLAILLEETLNEELIPATEVICASQAQAIVDAMQHFPKYAKVLLWIGSRNQNHFEQRQIAQVLANGPPNIHLMFKNQMWEDSKHWYGIFEHLKSKISVDRLLSCHRGFSPGAAYNPEKWRNLPNFQMASEMRRRMNIPMLLDPSHIAGESNKVKAVMDAAKDYDFDGFMIEVHDSPHHAKTDACQQLSYHELEVLLNDYAEYLYGHKVA
jgi:3-deoxy-D-arabino-heptulosonate 7-phosphate (DAHP) synthase